MSASLVIVIKEINDQFFFEVSTVSDKATESELRLLQVFHFSNETIGEEVLKRLKKGLFCHIKDIKSYSAKLANAALDGGSF